MVDYGDLYDEIKKVKENNERNNFNIYMNKLVSRLETKLNNAYQNSNKNDYDKLLNNVKKEGLRVFRNPDGKHKIVVEGW